MLGLRISPLSFSAFPAGLLFYLLFLSENYLILSKNELILQKNDLIPSGNDLIPSENDLIPSENHLILSGNHLILSENDIILSKNDITPLENEPFFSKSGAKTHEQGAVATCPASVSVARRNIEGNSPLFIRTRFFSPHIKYSCGSSVCRYEFSHSPDEIPACLKILRNKSTDISRRCGFGITRRKFPFLINWCFPPLYGPSNPSFWSFRTSSIRSIGASFCIFISLCCLNDFRNFYRSALDFGNWQSLCNAE